VVLWYDRYRSLQGYARDRETERARERETAREREREREAWPSAPPATAPRVLTPVTDNLMDFDALIQGKELQCPDTDFMDKTHKHPASTYKTTFLVLSQGLEPFPLGSGIQNYESGHGSQGPVMLVSSIRGKGRQLFSITVYLASPMW